MKFKRGDIVLAELGTGIGSEQNGTRPVLIVSNDIGNTHASTITIAPITSAKKNFGKTHIAIELVAPSTILCEACRTIDKKRCIKFIKCLDTLTMNEVNEKLKIALGI